MCGSPEQRYHDFASRSAVPSLFERVVDTGPARSPPLRRNAGAQGDEPAALEGDHLGTRGRGRDVVAGGGDLDRPRLPWPRARKHAAARRGARQPRCWSSRPTPSGRTPSPPPGATQPIATSTTLATYPPSPPRPRPAREGLGQPPGESSGWLAPSSSLTTARSTTTSCAVRPLISASTYIARREGRPVRTGAPPIRVPDLRDRVHHPAHRVDLALRCGRFGRATRASVRRTSPAASPPAATAARRRGRTAAGQGRRARPRPPRHGLPPVCGWCSASSRGSPRPSASHSRCAHLRLFLRPPEPRLREPKPRADQHLLVVEPVDPHQHVARLEEPARRERGGDPGHAGPRPGARTRRSIGVSAGVRPSCCVSSSGLRRSRTCGGSWRARTSCCAIRSRGAAQNGPAAKPTRAAVDLGNGGGSVAEVGFVLAGHAPDSPVEFRQHILQVVLIRKQRH